MNSVYSGLIIMFGLSVGMEAKACSVTDAYTQADAEIKSVIRQNYQDVKSYSITGKHRFISDGVHFAWDAGGVLVAGYLIVGSKGDLNAGTVAVDLSNCKAVATLASPMENKEVWP